MAWALICSLSAQTNEENFEAFELNFSTPGARSAAMGRTFIGLADDASAAVTNPAGLTFTEKFQFYFEFKNIDYTTQRLASPDSLSTGQPSEFGESVNSASFINVAWKPNRKWAVAFTAHEFLSFEERASLEERDIPGGAVAFPPGRIEVDYQGRSYAGSVAFGQPDDLIRLGLTVSANRIDAQSQLTRFATGAITGILSESSINDEDWAVGYTIGTLVNAKELSIGLAYSRGPSFQLEIGARSCAALSASFPPMCILLPFSDFPKDFTFKVPDRLGGGIWAPLGSIAFLFDVVHTRYSQLSDNLTPVAYADSGKISSANYENPNTTEVHFGTEWGRTAFGNDQLFLRGGLFSEVPHNLRYSSPTGDSEIDPVETARLNRLETKTRLGFSLGGGINFNNRLQLDGAFVNGEGSNEVVVSLAYHLSGR